VAELRQEGFQGVPKIERTISMRYAGQNYEQDIRVDAPVVTDEALQQVFRAFERRHEEFYGYSISGEVIELIRFNVTAVGRTPKPRLRRLDCEGPPVPIAERPVAFAETGFVRTPVYRRELLSAGATLVGPAIVEEIDSTILIHPETRLAVNEYGIVTLTLSV
jgi:N-methylhydantoinase A